MSDLPKLDPFADYQRAPKDDPFFPSDTIAEFHTKFQEQVAANQPLQDALAAAGMGMGMRVVLFRKEPL